MRNHFKAILDKLPYISELRRQVNEQGAFGAGHYYSPIPSRSDIVRGRNGNCPSFPDINLQEAEQRKLIEEFADSYNDLPFGDKQVTDGSRYYYDQGWFCHSDAIMLYCMIRKYNFKHIIEVGSGFSSAAMLDTLESLGREDYRISFIEPYPDRLNDLIDVSEDRRVTLYEDDVQSVPLELFSALEAGDLLFIDSSHVLKYQSDLHYLLFNVLPKLKPGVFVHFHDIFYPFEYPTAWLEEGRYWNECYFLRAFLSGNKHWEIVLFNSYVNEVFDKLIEDKLPLCRKNFGGSIYLRKSNHGNNTS